jgi:hypothetical protein
VELVETLTLEQMAQLVRQVVVVVVVVVD